MTKPKPVGRKDLTHTDAAGRARMVAVTAKADTVRTARAEGTITMIAECLEAIETNAVSKGDVISTPESRGSWRRRRPPSSFPSVTLFCSPTLASTSISTASFPGCEFPHGFRREDQREWRWKH